MTDIFDIKNVSDLPKNIQDELLCMTSPKKNFEKCVIGVLVHAPDKGVNTDQISIAIYRKYKKVFKRNTLATRLSKMAKDKEIERVSHGLYRGIR